MLNGTREEICESARKCIDAGSSAEKGFNLATGCDIPETADPEHIKWLMEEVRRQNEIRINR
jgi:uroporphyrinogen decarboxylase